MKLTSLAPRLMMHDGHGFVAARSVAEAHVLMFTCPHCAAVIDLTKRHKVTAWSGLAPQELEPGSPRVTFEGTSVDDVTVTAAGQPSPVRSLPCDWQGQVVHGEVHSV